jgi:hypothetical protein
MATVFDSLILSSVIPEFMTVYPTLSNQIYWTDRISFSSRGRTSYDASLLAHIDPMDLPHFFLSSSYCIAYICFRITEYISFRKSILQCHCCCFCLLRHGLQYVQYHACNRACVFNFSMLYILLPLSLNIYHSLVKNKLNSDKHLRIYGVYEEK